MAVANLSKNEPIFCGQMVSEKIVGSQFDRFFWCDQQNVDSRTAIHPEISFGSIGLLETVEPVWIGES